MAKKKANKNIPIPILILICAVLLHAIYTSVSTLALAIWGDSVMGTVDSYDSRLDNTKAEQNRSRTHFRSRCSDYPRPHALSCHGVRCG